MSRDGAAIGAGLAPTRAARAIVAGERIHVVGAGGAGASGAALLAHAAGALVDGCDVALASPYLAALQAEGLRIAEGHDPAHVTRTPRPDRLAVTKALTAIDPDHPELAAARRLGIAVEPWQQLVADAAVGRELIGVAGTHGKSTTAGWLVHLLVTAGEDPSAFVGALMPSSLTGGLPATARIGAGASFVVEADEYAGNFDPYHPAIAVVTGAEWDHPDVFADRAAVIAAFARWLEAAAAARAAFGMTPPILVANVSDAGAETLVRRLTDWPGTILATALLDGPEAPRPGVIRGIAEQYATRGGRARALIGRVIASDPKGTTLEMTGLDPLAGETVVRLLTAGRHNASNALGVAGAALARGLTPVAIREGLATFTGVGRRLEWKGEARGVVVYDDYGHHPTAIRETLRAVRQREPDRRIWAVYEPLTFHRTAVLLDDFAAALGEADAVAIADIWAGRDTDTTIATAAGLAAAVAEDHPGLQVGAPGSVEATAAWLAERVRPGDAVLVMGGGRSYRIGDLLLEHLA
ncbi:MAG TPA: cyanophycin synthetase [Candidatus Acidoferrum sp.]|nr:cyanophycin synthetase [Candidatus Acidoferrum sp.]